MGKIQKHWLLLYVAFPATLAVYNGVRGSFWAPELSTFKCIILYLACALPLYICAAVMSHSSLKATRRLQIHPLVALLTGGAVALFLSYFYVVFLVQTFSSFFPGVEAGLAANETDLVGGLRDYIAGQSGVLFMSLWLLVHFTHEQITKEVCFFRGLIAAQPSDQIEADVAVPPSGLLARLSPDIGRNILAIEAQEHYVRVYTDTGQDLILYRFGDAMTELEARYPGRRVHRSYWVADDAVTEIRKAGKSYRLTIRNGLEIPVSLSHRGSIQRHHLMTRLEPQTAK